MGAPNLTDNVWLHGWGEATIVSMVNSGKTNVMPALADRLSADQIHVLAAYVWSLSQTLTWRPNEVPRLTASLHPPDTVGRHTPGEP